MALRSNSSQAQGDTNLSEQFFDCLFELRVVPVTQPTAFPPAVVRNVNNLPPGTPQNFNPLDVRLRIGATVGSEMVTPINFNSNACSVACVQEHEIESLLSTTGNAEFTARSDLI